VAREFTREPSSRGCQWWHCLIDTDEERTKLRKDTEHGPALEENPLKIAFRLQYARTALAFQLASCRAVNALFTITALAA
jgi:hypothetical protein